MGICFTKYDENSTGEWCDTCGGPMEYMSDGVYVCCNDECAYKLSDEELAFELSAETT